MKPEIVHRSVWGMGLICLDVIIDVDGSKHYYAGGSCGNVMAILGYLGWSAQAIGRIGDDSAGRFVVHDLERWGVNTAFVTDKGARTPVIIERLHADAQGKAVHRFEMVCPSCGKWLPRYRAFRIADLLTMAQDPPDAFYFDRASPAAIRAAEVARAHGGMVVFEPNSVPDRRLFRHALRATDVFKYSAAQLGGVSELPEAQSCRVQIETLGLGGLRVRFGSERSISNWTHLPAVAPACNVRDTAGAGDWLTSVFIDRVTNLSPEDCVESLRLGQAVAAIKCGFLGPRSIMDAIGSHDLLEEANLMLTQSTPTRRVVSVRAHRPEAVQLCDTCRFTAGASN